MSVPLSLEEALAFRAHLLEEVVCSAPWLDGIVEQDEDGAWRIDPERFPPPGMEACLHCGRICPPPGPRDRWCADCETHHEEVEFVGWAQHSEVKDQLYRRWWRNVTYSDLIDRGLQILGRGIAEPEDSEGASNWGPQGSTSEFHVVEREIWQRLKPKRRRTGQAPGCQITLLPESEAQLLREIEYFRTHGHVAPSAQRLSPCSRDAMVYETQGLVSRAG